MRLVSWRMLLIMRDKSITVLDMEPITQETITPKEYVRMTEKARQNIDSVRVIPPVLGKNSFGKLVVQYENPVSSSRKHTTRS